MKVTCFSCCLVLFFVMFVSHPFASPSLASDHPHVFKEDVVARAKHYAAGLGGGVGAYTNSQGIPAVREVNT